MELTIIPDYQIGATLTHFLSCPHSVAQISQTASDFLYGERLLHYEPV